ncbi:MAG TPA: SMC family ATPase [Nitrososphaerales archaeon]|nr:SMC family ATPase [Nitrososphaerales archaeon]
MLLKRIGLKNIRSYNDGEEVGIELPEGVVLFEGDIGSGKSTLLYAVEFALFGLSDVKGGHLLSEGKNDGHVTVTFLADGSEYVVRRGLRRRGSEVVQENCSIASAGARESISPSDLKQRIVAILRFNEPTHPRAESLVYRYAVFTPQEQMKEILLQNVETRFQVLRRVLGVQSYEVAAENSGLVARKVAEISYGLNKSSADLEEVKANLREKETVLEDLDSRLPGLGEAEATAAGLVDGLESQWKGLRDKREEVKAVTGKIPVIEERICDLVAEEADASEKVRELEERIQGDINPRIGAFESTRRPTKSAETFDGELKVAATELQTSKEARAVLESQLRDTGDLISKGVCPVCGQKIPPNFERSQHAQKESVKVSERIASFEAQVARLTDETAKARDFEEEERVVLSLVKEKADIEREVKHLEARLEKIGRELLKNRSELDSARREVSSIAELSASLDKLEGDLDTARLRARDAGIAVARAKTQREEVTKERERLLKTVASKEVLKSRAQTLGNYEGWLHGFFLPTIGIIEEQTLTQANSRFNQHFQRFFTTLVDDHDLAVRVKEDFSPVFERQGFEQEYEALSGGERTSMALAYRFALNSVVREDISARTELVILDEPTDGFSKDQVYKMRDLLEELDSTQVILVSHERELESMADHIFRVTKSNGTSKVSKS